MRSRNRKSFWLAWKKKKKKKRNRKKREDFSCHWRPTVCVKVPDMLIFWSTILQMGFWDWEVKKFECSDNTFEGQGSNQTCLSMNVSSLLHGPADEKRTGVRWMEFCMWLTYPFTVADEILLIQPALAWALMFLAPDGKEIPALTELKTSREISAHTHTHTHTHPSGKEDRTQQYKAKSQENRCS